MLSRFHFSEDLCIVGMKLYVWHDSLIDYTAGVMFALANSVEEAREMIKLECSYVPEWELNAEPRVYDYPCGFLCWGGG